MSRKSVKVLWVFGAIVLAVAAGASVASADEQVVAHVPFAFIAGDSRLPAGDYIVREVDNDPSMISIGSTHGHQSTFMLTIASSSVGREAAPGLVFDKFDNQYFLARVVRGDGNDREIVLTPAIMEHEAAAAR